ncbi:MAG: DNA recombination protein RmuC [Thiotrichales bacterium]|nr:DNA recombination protein RmuC [Thiotrichales bacterium]
MELYFWPALSVAGFLLLVLGRIVFRQAQQLAKQQLELESAHQTAYQLDTLRQQHAQWEKEQQTWQQQLRDYDRLQGEFSALQRQQQDQHEVLQQKNHLIETLQQAQLEAQSQLASLQSELRLLKEGVQEKLAFAEQAKTQLAQEFTLLANQIFNQKQQELGQLNRDSLGAILQPMQQSLDQFRLRIETTHKESLEGRAGLQQQLKQLQELNSQITQETKNLTQALKGDSKLQGNWGELVLERLLERSGLREGIEFDREKSFALEDGSRLRPDVILNLPGAKHVIIDSKVSLKHYELALNSDTPEAGQAAFKAHLQSVKKHIDALATKRYDHLALLNAPDFVLMFIPIEGAYLMTIEREPGIFEEAFDKRVAVVTPTTLFTTLKTIEQLWRYERQSENTRKLISRAAEVHDKFVGFVETFEKVGKQLEQASNSYQQARSRMFEGNGNLIRQAQMLKALAGKTKKELPESLLQQGGWSADELETLMDERPEQNAV